MHAMECYSAIKWDAVMLLARKLKELKITTLSEVKLTKTSVICFPSCMKSTGGRKEHGSGRGTHRAVDRKEKGGGGE